MNTEEFIDLVRRMRKTQKQYFATRDTTVLRESKDLERRVDQMLDPPVTTPGLFEGNGNGQATS